MQRITLTDNSGRWFDKDSAKEWSAAAIRVDASTLVSRATGKSWEHETLYLASSGRFIMHFSDDHNPTLDQYIEWDETKAIQWLLANGHHTHVDRLYAGKRSGQYKV